MARKYIRRKQTRRFPKHTYTPKLHNDVDREEIEQRDTDVLKQNYSPNDVLHLQRTLGNQFVINLLAKNQSTDQNVQRQSDDVGTINTVSSPSKTPVVQRVNQPNNSGQNTRQQNRTNAYVGRQLTLPLNLAFGNVKKPGILAYDDVVDRFKARFNEWKQGELDRIEQMTKDSWFGGVLGYYKHKTERVEGYKNIEDMLSRNDKKAYKDFQSLRKYAIQEQANENLNFIIAVRIFFKNPTESEFLKIIDKYVTPGAVNITGPNQDALLERASQIRGSDSDTSITDPSTNNIITSSTFNVATFGVFDNLLDMHLRYKNHNLGSKHLPLKQLLGIQDFSVLSTTVPNVEEYLKFKKYCKKEGGVDDNFNYIEAIRQFVNHPNLELARHIFESYIDVGSEYEVNIKHWRRQRLMELFNPTSQQTEQE